LPDDATTIDETLDALDRLVRDGKVREIGCSNFGGSHIDEAEQSARRHGTERFVSVQNELSLLKRDHEAELLDACIRNDLQILPFYPLASGLLTGKYKRGEAPPAGTRIASMPEDSQEQALSDRRFDIVDALDAFARERGHSLLELATCWLTGLPHLASVISGATKPDQVRANVAAAGWVLSDDERAEVDALTSPD
jgi:aryl-alcohol dehydrogenase-like predicted oxidoreductase